MKVYFYSRGRLRDRQLDTVRTWPRADVVNFGTFESNVGTQVPKSVALHRRQAVVWPQRLPLINLKLRPRDLPPDVAVYVWGAVVATGPFIVDLDNPYALTGYNLRAMTLYRPLLRAFLGSPRCLAIRCMSAACRESIRILFGDAVAAKAQVRYPSSGLRVAAEVPRRNDDECRFLFVSTQFEIKGGVALLRAFRRVLEVAPNARLDLITHLPPEHQPLLAACGNSARIHEARLSRNQVFEQFITTADVLIHPTYLDSFGMIALEGLAGGLGLIVTDVYALRELVEEGVNGMVLPAPISVWDGYLPSRHYYRLGDIKDDIKATNTTAFEEQLFRAMEKFATDKPFRTQARFASLARFRERFRAS
jgi:glycosyltransferase involved in cell wall biosynthesis